ncbi:MAG: hypothetical protein KIT02_07160 [Devosia sp.]|uniref:hypothetical protein n=1 Tax=Devosia sp. TaxID=1871048 RepID=UPI0024CA713C|nr:hypothetical protein [Devosia sp.]UYO00974.1 MAG: hypothetical protein KIT02_07160 [Devosia sp.]
MLSALGTGLVAAVPLIALLVGVTPAQAANFVAQPDTQIAVFMVPLTLLLVVLLFEAVRFVRRGTIPAQVPSRRPRPMHWAKDDRS